MYVCCECCVLSGRGLCDGLVPRPQESYRLWCVSNVCDHETSTKRGDPGTYGAVEPYKKKYLLHYVISPIYTHVHSRQLASRSQCPRHLRRMFAAARLLGLRVRIPPGHGCLFLVNVVCVFRYRFLRRADPSSRGVLQFVCVCHWLLLSATITLYTYNE
jgi:hypothetical protein